MVIYIALWVWNIVEGYSIIFHKSVGIFHCALVTTQVSSYILLNVNAHELPANYLVELGVNQILNVVQMEYYRRFMEYDGKSIDNIPLL